MSTVCGPTLSCEYLPAHSAGTNRALYFHYKSPPLLSKPSNKFKEEIIYYITQCNEIGTGEIQTSPHPTPRTVRHCNGLPREVLQSPFYFEQEVGLEASEVPSNLTYPMVQQNQMCFSFLWNVCSLFLYVQHNFLFSDSH